MLEIWMAIIHDDCCNYGNLLHGVATKTEISKIYRNIEMTAYMVTIGVISMIVCMFLYD